MEILKGFYVEKTFSMMFSFSIYAIKCLSSIRIQTLYTQTNSKITKKYFLSQSSLTCNSLALWTACHCALSGHSRWWDDLEWLLLDTNEDSRAHYPMNLVPDQLTPIWWISLDRPTVPLQIYPIPVKSDCHRRMLNSCSLNCILNVKSFFWYLHKILT